MTEHSIYLDNAAALKRAFALYSRVETHPRAPLPEIWTDPAKGGYALIAGDETTVTSFAWTLSQQIGARWDHKPIKWDDKKTWVVEPDAESKGASGLVIRWVEGHEKGRDTQLYISGLSTPGGLANKLNSLARSYGARAIDKAAEPFINTVTQAQDAGLSADDINTTLSRIQEKAPLPTQAALKALASYEPGRVRVAPRAQGDSTRETR